MFSLENEVNPNSSSSSSVVFTSSSSTTIRELRADPTAAAVTAAAANAPAAVNFAISPSLELSVTVVYTVLYSCLFVFVYLQLWLVLHYGHKRLSYQTVFLFLCLLWAALRTTLFSFYFKNTSAVVALQASSRRLQPLVYWLLYCLPVCLQFFTLCLLNLYFAQLMFKAKAKYSPELTKYKIPLRLAFLCLGIFFLVVNLTCALLVQGALERFESPSDAGIRHAVLARVLVNDSLFVLCAISLAVCLFKIAKMSSANVYLESKGTSVCQATAIGALVVLLYTSRACYNLVVVSLSPQDQPSPFNYGWYNISEQADVQEVSGEAYIVFGIILFFWELLPTSLVVIFFRVQKPNQNLASGGMINSHSFSSRAYFFDNPRRYDSDDDLTRSITSRADRASLLTSAPQLAPSSWYGSIQRAGSLTGAMAPPAAPSSSTAPLLFAYGNVQNGHHHHHNHHNYYSTPQGNNFQHHHHQQQHHQTNYYSTPQNYNYGSQNYLCTPQN